MNKTLCRTAILGVTIPALSILASPSRAHIEHLEEIDTQVQALSSFTYRSDYVVEPGQPYLIPGALMGGEGVPSEKGFVFDEAQLKGQWKSPHHYYLEAKISAHASDEIEIENLAFVAPSVAVLGGATFEVGKLGTETTSTANWHSSQNIFSEPNLLGDVFFGRHFNDVGFRISRVLGPMRLGIEGYNGDNWPATSAKGTAAAFAQFDFRLALFDMSVDIWGMQSQAQDRTDTRYSAGHSHGGNIISSSSTNFFFAGDIAQYGGIARLKREFGDSEIRADFEWISSNAEGDIYNATQTSLYENLNEGVRIFLAYRLAKHTLSMQYEEIALQNDLLSPVTSLFAESANLINNGFEPSKTIVSWSYDITPETTLRIEGVTDNSLSDKGVNKINLGLKWQRVLF